MKIISKLKHRKKINNKYILNHKNIVAVSCLLLMFLLGFSLTGCDKSILPHKEDYLEGIASNTLILNEDGNIREVACEDFSQAGLDATNLEDDIKKDINSYCATNGEDSIKLLQYENNEGKVKVAIEYSSIGDYNSFNGTDYKVISASELDSETEVTGLGGSATTYGEVARDNFKAVIIDGDYNLTVNGEILYYNSHVKSVSDKSTAVTDGEGEAVIIYQ